jgi:hypothetical protein
MFGLIVNINKRKKINFLTNIRTQLVSNELLFNNEKNIEIWIITFLVNIYKWNEYEFETKKSFKFEDNMKK